MISRRIILILLIAILAGIASYLSYNRNTPESAAGRLLKEHPAYFASWRFAFLSPDERERALQAFQASVDEQKPGIVSEALDTIRTGSPAARRRAQLVLTRAGTLSDRHLQPLRTSSNPAVWGYAALHAPYDPTFSPDGIDSAAPTGTPEAALDEPTDQLKQRFARLEFDEPERLLGYDAMDLDGDGDVELVARTYAMGANWHTSRLYVFARHGPDAPVRLKSGDPAGRLRFLQKTPDGPILVATASFICPIGLANTVERRMGQPGLCWTLHRWTGRSFESAGHVLTPFPEATP